MTKTILSNLGQKMNQIFKKNNLIIIKKMKQEVNIVIGNLNYKVLTIKEI